MSSIAGDVPGGLGVVALRHRLHRHPELRFGEHATSALLKETVEAFGVEVLSGVAGTGLVASVGSSRTGPNVLVRADMDAYPVVEETGLPWASSVPGVSHACGHDIHMAVVVGLLSRFAADPPAAGALTAVFQPAEEIPYGQPSGGRAMVHALAAAGVSADAVLGLHCWPDLPVGAVGVDAGIAMAAKLSFAVTVEGRAAHAASPAEGRDAILAAAALITGVHLAGQRSVNPGETLAINIGTVTGGTSQSSLAARVDLTGTVRAHDDTVIERLVGVLERVAEGIAREWDVNMTLAWADQMPAVINAPELSGLALRLIGDRATRLTRPALTTDDFALYRELGPTLYLKLGVSAPDGSPSGPLHSSQFCAGDEAISIGVDALEVLTRHLLGARP